MKNVDLDARPLRPGQDSRRSGWLEVMEGSRVVVQLAMSTEGGAKEGRKASSPMSP